mmetsp:Transcript_58340/g.139075  ORF Transcript_58340/g.139075 Transcript_58340/m.139075 type:complete len:100 (+) Transcript_58340:122-421(+)
MAAIDYELSIATVLALESLDTEEMEMPAIIALYVLAENCQGPQDEAALLQILTFSREICQHGDYISKGRLQRILHVEAARNAPACVVMEAVVDATVWEV